MSTRVKRTIHNPKEIFIVDFENKTKTIYFHSCLQKKNDYFNSEYIILNYIFFSINYVYIIGKRDLIFKINYFSFQLKSY